jgi:sec-independent protein translocase protein TatA
MLGNLNGWHLLILLAVILLLFGAAKLPALAKSVGQSARVFKGEMKAMKDEDHSEGKTEQTVGTPPYDPSLGQNASASTTPPAPGASSDTKP